MVLPKLRHALRRVGALRRCQQAASAVEYGLILSLIVLAMLVALRNVAANTVSMWNFVGNKVNDSTPQ